MLFPLFAFCFAAVTELRSDKKRGEKSLSLIPIVLGLVVYGFAWGPLRLFHVTLPSPLSGRVMALISAFIASSGAFISYSRRSSSILVALGGLEITFIYMFFNEPII